MQPYAVEVTLNTLLWWPRELITRQHKKIRQTEATPANSHQFNNKCAVRGLLHVKDSCTTVLNDLFCPTVVDEVWREQTLLRLLNLVELPLLEGLLQCSQAPSSAPRSNVLAHSNPDLICSSNYLDRQILKAFRDSQCVPSG